MSSIPPSEQPSTGDSLKTRTAKKNLVEKKHKFVAEMAKRHVVKPITYEEFRMAAVPVFEFWEDGAYRELYGTFRRARVFEEMATLYPSSPCSYGEFAAATISEDWTEVWTRKIFTAFKAKMRTQWEKSERTNVQRCRIHAPYSDMLSVLSEMTGFRNDEVINFLISHFASQVLTQRVDLVDSIVAASTFTVEELALARRLLEPMNLSDDPRIKGLDEQRIAKRRRRNLIGSILGG